MENEILKLKNKILKFQKIFMDHIEHNDDNEYDIFEIKEFPGKLKYSIFKEGKDLLSLSLKDLLELRSRTGEEPFIRFYFLKTDKDIWEYFEDKNINNLNDYKEGIIGALMSYSLAENGEEYEE